MFLDVSKAFVRPMVEFPFEMEGMLAEQPVNGDTVTFDAVQLAGQYSMADDVIRLHGKLHTVAHAPCAVCLQPAQVDVDVDFEETFRKDANEEEDGFFRYEGKQLPLDHMVLTLVMLNLPMRFHCAGDCEAAVELKAWNEAETVWAEEDGDAQGTYRPFEGLKDLLGGDEAQETSENTEESAKKA